jgi:PAS domain S-box-containing protein
MRLVLTSNQPMFVFWGPKHLCLYNDAYRRTMGPERHPSALGAPGREVWGEIWDVVGPQVELVLSGCGATWHEEQLVPVTRHGQVEDVYWTYGYSPIHDESAPNFIGGVLVITADVTEQVTTRLRLQQSEASQRRALLAMQAILDNSMDIIATLDRDGTILQVSRSVTRLLNFQEKDLLGRRLTALVHPDDLASAAAKLAALSSGEATSTEFETRVIRFDGTFLPVLWSVAWVEHEHNIYAVGRDLTERIESERRLRHANRMETVGRLTGGIAHDFNNLLAIILGNAELLVEMLAHDPTTRSQAELISQAAERGASLVSRLLSYAQRQRLDSAVVDLGTVLPNLVPRLERHLNGTTTLELRIAEGTWPVSVDVPQLENTLDDLVTNGRDAMSAGGHLVVTCDHASIESAKDAKQRFGLVGSKTDIEAGDYVQVSVTDTGKGMTDEVLANAFEPFYTTKDIGHGTGLGLSMVLGFIRQSHGHVGVITRPGHGTTVHLLLPRSRRAALAPSQPVELPPAEASAPSSILVVDDEEVMRKHVAAHLARLGYLVQTAKDAEEALNVIGNGVPVDLLFTDVIMPGGMNGRQLVDEVRKTKPSIKVLYTSGYTAEALASRDGEDVSADLLLTKPYKKQELIAKVKAALERP